MNLMDIDPCWLLPLHFVSVYMGAIYFWLGRRRGQKWLVIASLPLLVGGAIAAVLAVIRVFF